MSALPFDKILEWMGQIGRDSVEAATQMLDDFKYYRQTILSKNSSIDEIYDAWIDLTTRYQRKFPPSMNLFNIFHKLISDLHHTDKKIDNKLRRDIHFKELRKDFEKDDDPAVNKIFFNREGQTTSSLQELRDKLLLEWKETIVRLIDSMDMSIGQNISISQVGDSISKYEDIIEGDDDVAKL